MDRPEDTSLVPPVNPQQQQQQDDEKPIKKRTKTGCQTCRARRVKCDEGKPECNNCVKARRECGGINPADQILTSALGYGTGTGSRGDGGMKKSRRHALYADKRIYKNIVPAPTKELDSSSSAVVSSAVQSRNPKRKRDREPDSPEEHIGIYAWWEGN
jgi:hypothetical protein